VLPGQRYLPEDILRIAWRRKWIILIPFVVATISGVLVTNRLPNKFKSETLILVVPQRVPESYVRPTVTAPIEGRLASIQHQILSRSRLERIIVDFSLYPEVRARRPMEAVVDIMRQDIEGPTLERGDAFRVAYVNHNARLAQQVTERLASLFIEENLRDRHVLAEGTSHFLDIQLDDARARLLEHERKLEIYRRHYSGELPDQVQSNLQAIQRAQIQIQTLQDSNGRDSERRLEFNRQIGELEAGTLLTVPAIAPPSTPSRPESITQQLAKELETLRVLQLRYTSEHPDVVGTKKRIGELQARLEAEGAAARGEKGEIVPVNPTELARLTRLRELRAEVTKIEGLMAARQDEILRQQSVIDSYQAKVDIAPTRQSDLTELMRDYSTLQSSYTSLVAKREDSRIAANLEKRQIGEQFKVLDPAQLPVRPFGPNRLRLNLMAAVAGLLLGLGIAGLLEYLDQSIKSEDDVLRVLQVPVLASIPMMRSERELVEQRRRRLLAGLAAGVAIVISVSVYAVWKLQVF
jgi:protein tyrosine kinase modulator